MSKSRFKVGERIYHRGTKRNATILEIKHDIGELKVQPDEPLFSGDPNGPTWWAYYHVEKGRWTWPSSAV